jgi:hypothetical protein
LRLKSAFAAMLLAVLDSAAFVEGELVFFFKTSKISAQNALLLLLLLLLLLERTRRLEGGGLENAALELLEIEEAAGLDDELEGGGLEDDVPELLEIEEAAGVDEELAVKLVRFHEVTRHEPGLELLEAAPHGRSIAAL